MTSSFYVFVKAIAQPYLWIMLLMGWCLMRGMMKERIKRRLAITLIGCWSLIFLMSIPVVSLGLMRTLEWRYVAQIQPDSKVDAIVTLGGGTEPPNALRSYPVVTGNSYQRCLHALSLHEHYNLPIILCGGATDAKVHPASEAEIMREMLLALGVEQEHIVLEDQSLNTFENARNSAQLLKELGYQCVLLVTDARHMRRAEPVFRKQGVNVIPSPSSFSSVGFDGEYFELFVPNVSGLKTSHIAINEWLGLTWYWMNGRI